MEMKNFWLQQSDSRYEVFDIDIHEELQKFVLLDFIVIHLLSKKLTCHKLSKLSQMKYEKIIKVFWKLFKLFAIWRFKFFQLIEK